MQTTDSLIHILSVTIYIIALIVIIQFYFKLKGDKYWVGLPISIFFFLVHELFEIYEHFTDSNMTLFIEGSEILASAILIVSVYGLSKELANIHELENVEENGTDVE